MLVPQLQQVISERCHALHRIYIRNAMFVSWNTLLFFARAAPHLQVFAVHSAILNDIVLTSIGQRMPQLTELDLTHCQGITKWSSAMPTTLRRLVLDHCAWPSSLFVQAFAHHSNLHILSLRGAALSDTLVSAISTHIPSLRSLQLGAYTDMITKRVSLQDGVVKPHFNLLSLIEVDLSGCPDITSSSLLALSKNSPQLTRLSLHGCVLISDSSVLAVAKRCVQLEWLDLSRTDITNVSLKALGRHLFSLHTLILTHCTAITGQGIRQLSGCSSLRHLDLSDSTKGEFDAWLGLMKYSQATDFHEIIKLGNSYAKLYIAPLTSSVSDA